MNVMPQQREIKSHMTTLSRREVRVWMCARFVAGREAKICKLCSTETQMLSQLKPGTLDLNNAHHGVKMPEATLLVILKY